MPEYQLGQIVGLIKDFFLKKDPYHPYVKAFYPLCAILILHLKLHISLRICTLVGLVEKIFPIHYKVKSPP